MKTQRIELSVFKNGKDMTQIMDTFNGDAFQANNFQNNAICSKLLVFKSDAKFYIDETQPSNKGVVMLVDSLGRIQITH